MIKNTLLAFAAATALATGAQAVTVVNGSFEDGAAISGGFDLLTAGSTAITGWTILPNDIDYVDNSIWDAQSGSRSVELAGFGPGGVEQQIDNQFTLGQQYRISFWMSANPFAAAGTFRVFVSAQGGAEQEFSYTTTAANSPNNMLYQQYFYDWAADSTSSTITFRTIDSGIAGVILDNVSISAFSGSVVPEPSTWALLIAGFGMSGFALRRRRTLAVAA